MQDRMSEPGETTQTAAVVEVANKRRRAGRSQFGGTHGLAGQRDHAGRGGTLRK